MRLGETRLMRNRRIECGQGVIVAAKPAERHAEQIVGAGVLGARGDRLLRKIRSLGKSALLTGDHCEVVERICVGRLACQYLLVAANRLGQITSPVEQDGFLQKCIGSNRHGMSWHRGDRGRGYIECFVTRGKPRRTPKDSAESRA